MDRTKPFVCKVHRCVANRTTRWVAETVLDFANYVSDINICTIDWRRPAYYEYKLAAKRNVYEVGRYVA